ncbi:MAG: ATP-grasp domain-containing protein [Firmicutes bacterium]|nr:ATP-grasp domain-containing protein [Bacillota bacterium]
MTRSTLSATLPQMKVVSMGLRVGLTYNLKTDCPPEMRTSEDAGAEYESQETVEDIAQALEELGHQVILLPYNEMLPRQLAEVRVDIVFNIAEGWFGRNRESLVPALLEFYNVPYTGSDPLTLGLTLDKALCKQVVNAAGVPTADGIVVTNPVDDRLAQLEYPVFIKPNAEGSSKGVRSWSKADDPLELREKLTWVLETYRQPVLVEEFLPGREFTVALIGNGTPRVLPVMEVLPGDQCPQDAGFIYSFEVKSGNLERFSCPAAVDSQLLEKIQEMALQVFTAVGCRDIGRIDIRLDREGNPRFLEINPLPGLSRVSLLPLQAQAAGMSFAELIEAILSAAISRYSHLNSGFFLKEAAFS